MNEEISALFQTVFADIYGIAEDERVTVKWKYDETENLLSLIEEIA